jgi:hypothetical protein
MTDCLLFCRESLTLAVRLGGDRFSEKEAESE